MPSIRVSYDEGAVQRNVEKILKRKLDAGTSIDTKMEVAGEYASAVERYVPYKSGKLAHSARIVADGNVANIRYSARSFKGKHYDYAQWQYDTPVPQENRTTPGTYDHWNKHLTTAERKAFYEEAAKIVAREMKNG